MKNRPENRIAHDKSSRKSDLFIKKRPENRTFQIRPENRIFLRIWAWDLAQMLDHPHLFFGGLNESSGGLK